MKVVFSLLFAILYTFTLAYFAQSVQREDFIFLILIYSLLFGLYILFISTVKLRSFKVLLILTIFFRIPFIATDPQLSDDVYRFEWDARLNAVGIDPYAVIPEDIPEEVRLKIDPNDELFSKLNSPTYHSIYTPFNQLIFSALSALSGSWSSLLVLYHIFFILVDILAAYLLFSCLKLLNRPISESLIYLANPLLIIEGVGNFHFESLVACLILLAIFLFLHSRMYFGALSFGFAAMLKLIPVILLPLVLRFRSVKWLLISGGVVLLLVFSLIPVFSGADASSGFSSSIDLYFRKFEFNASLYYLLRELGFMWKGYNLIAVIGPMLSLAFFIFTISFSWFFPYRRSFYILLGDAILIYLIYFICSTTVHPWYIIPMLMLGVLGRWRYPVVWTLLIFLSYSHYSQGEFNEHYSLILVEYLVLFSAVLIEHRTKRKEKDLSVSPL